MRGSLRSPGFDSRSNESRTRSQAIRMDDLVQMGKYRTMPYQDEGRAMMDTLSTLLQILLFHKTEFASMTTIQRSNEPFQFPAAHGNPAFYTIQPTASSRQSQLEKWSRLIQRYCRHYKIFELSIVDYQDKDLFKNERLKKTLFPENIKKVLDFMVSQDGQQRAEWVTQDKASAWIYWRRPEEWANSIAAWVDETGQKGSVLTLYEIVEGEASETQEFHGMDMVVLKKGLAILAKQGKAQVFGANDQQGVKFF